MAGGKEGVRIEKDTNPLTEDTVGILHLGIRHIRLPNYISPVTEVDLEIS